MIVTHPNETDLARYRFRVTLSGVVFGFRFYFNRRADRWFCDVFDGGNNRIRAGLKLVAEFPLFYQWTQQGRPVGQLSALDPSSQTDAGLNDLGSRVLATYDDENF